MHHQVIKQMGHRDLIATCEVTLIYDKMRVQYIDFACGVL